MIYSLHCSDNIFSPNTLCQFPQGGLGTLAARDGYLKIGLENGFFGVPGLHNMMKTRWVLFSGLCAASAALLIASCDAKGSDARAGVSATPGILDLRGGGGADLSTERWIPVDERLKRRQQRISETLDKYGTPPRAASK